MRRRFLKNMAAACAALLMLFAHIPAGYAADGGPAVNDTNNALFSALESAGKTHANIHYYTIGELRSWTGALNLGYRGITSIEGLQYCTALTTLTLNGNSGLSSIAPLDGEGEVPYSLQTLNLGQTNISDLPNDLQMPHLRTLDLSNTPVTDTGLDGIISGNLPVLSSLDLSKCSALHNITSIGNINTLTELYLTDSGLTDLPDDLSGMSGLKYLSINGYLPQNASESKGPQMHIASFAGSIATLPKFKNANTESVSLNISNTDVTNASFLNACAGLKYLYWEYMDSAPSTFPTCANLYYLNLSNDTSLGNGALASIAAIPSFHTLSATPATLCVSATNVTNVSSLSTAAGLRTLYWQGMPSLASASGLGSLTQLTNVDLVNDTGLHDGVLATIAALPNINTLGIGNCGITDLSGISSKTGITSLSIGHNKVTSLEPLRNWANLNALVMNSNYVSDLSPLAGKPINRIDCSQNYLDTTAGSADMQVLGSLPATGGNKYYANPFEITIHYNPSIGGAPSIPDDTVFYEQSFTPPTLTSADPAFSFLGWDADGSDGTAHLDVQNGRSTAVTLTRPIYPGDPVPSNEITYTAVYGYNISASVNNANYGTVTGTGAYQSGTSATLHAVPATGFHFVRWTEGTTTVSTSADYTFTVTGARTLSAEFAVNTYAVAASANNAAYGTVSGAGTYSHNATATLTATPNNGYGFVRWSEGGSTVSADAAYTFAVTGARTLVAEFGPCDYTVNASPNNTGYGTVTGQGAYAFGASATLHAVPNTGYHFVRWTEGGSEVTGAVADYAFTISSNRTLVAEFAPDKHTIAASPNDESMGSASGAGTYDYNSAATLGASPKAGCYFVQWTENGTPVSSTTAFTFTVTGDRTFVAVFSKLGAPGLTAVSGGVSSIRLTWTPADGAAGYEIWRSLKSSGNYTKIGDSSTTSYTDKNLKINTNYYYKVRAATAEGFGEYSNISAAKPLPLAPANVTAKKKSKTAVKITWSAVPDASGYMVYQVKSNGAVKKLLKTVSKAVKSCTFSGLKKGKTCYYKICAYKKAGAKTYKGPYSAVVSVKL